MKSEYIADNEFLRLDSEFFNKESLAFAELITSKKHATLENISEITSGKTPQYDTDGTIPIIRSGDLNYKWLDMSSLLKVKSNKDVFNLNKNDILISSIGQGSIGKVDVFYKDGDYGTVSEVTVLRKTEINPFYLAQYLSTKFGQSFINRYITGATGQVHLNKSSIKNILVPIVNVRLQNNIEELVISSFNDIERSKNLYEQTETLLLDAIGVKIPNSKNNFYNIKSFKDAFLINSRIDAEYYQKKYDYLESQIMSTGQAVKLGSVLYLNKRGTQPIYIESGQGFPVLNSKHIRANKIDFSDNRLGDPDEAKSELIIRKNDVLINGTGVGTIGRCAVYMKDDPALPDNHVTILRTEIIDPVFLSVMLNSVIGKMQVEKYFKGSSGQIELYPTDINEFIIWKAPVDLQKEIRRRIEEAEKLRNQSMQLLDVAKKAVEIAIEQDETTALNFINKSKF